MKNNPTVDLKLDLYPDTLLLSDTTERALQAYKRAMREADETNTAKAKSNLRTSIITDLCQLNPDSAETLALHANINNSGIFTQDELTQLATDLTNARSVKADFDREIAISYAHLHGGNRSEGGSVRGSH